MRRLRNRARRLSLAVVAVLAVGVVGGAWAYFTSSGTGLASASIGTLSAPTLSATAGAGTVSLSWNAITPPGSGPVTYYVTRDGGSPAGTCPTSASPTGVTSCTDSGVSVADHSYTVIAVWRSWTATSSAKTVTVASGPLDHFVISGYPSPTTAGASHSFTVTATDASGNTVAGYAGTAHFTSSDGNASLPADYTFVAGDHGAHSFTATLTTAGTQSITATDTGNSSITGAQTGIAVAPSTASTLTVSGYPSTTTAGVSHSLAVTAKDQFGNTATGYTGTIHFTSSDGNAALPANYTFLAGDNGTHSFSATLKTAGTQSITATDTVTNSITGSQTSIVVNPNSATTFVVSGYPSSTTAGTSHSITVTAKDQFGNTANGYTGTIHFTSSDGNATLPANYTFLAGDNGTHTFSGLVLKTSGTQSITATDTGNSSVTGAQTGIAVAASNASTLTVSGYPSTTTAGVSHALTVTAKDQFGNTATGYTGTIHFTSTDSAAGLPSDYTFLAGDNGTHSFSATLKTAGTQSITATDTITNSITGNQTSIVVNPNSAATLVVSGYPSSTTSGTSHSITVTAKDQFGNTANGYTGTIHFTSSDGNATLPANYTFLAGDSGTHTFSGVVLKHFGSQSITATDTVSGTVTGSQTGIVVSASQLTLSAATGNPSAGTADNLTIAAKDALGNTDTGYTGSHSLTFSGASASPNSTQPTVTNSSGTATAFGSATSITFSSGQATVSGSNNGQMKLPKAGSTSITASDGTINSTSTPLSVFVNSAGVTVAYSSGCPITINKNSTNNPLSISIPNDAFGNAFTTQSSAAFGLTITNTTNFGFGTVGTATTTLNVTTGPANNGFSIAESGGSKTASLTMTTVPSGFTAPAACTINAN